MAEEAGAISPAEGDQEFEKEIESSTFNRSMAG